MLILPFNASDASLSQAGGKGLNLVRLTRAGFPVPPGFILSTLAYRAFVAENKLQGVIDHALHEIVEADPAGYTTASGRIRSAFTGGTVPEEMQAALLAAYGELGQAPVAVRSSATAEDLPDLSFAGQQDTFLNIIDEQALLKAVVDCWSSLWTARAIGYRMRNDIDHSQVALAVIVQHLVVSDVSGVLFTANPLTGRLSETVIDATIGLGEALVSGQVVPDHYIVDTLSGQVIEKSVGNKQLVTRTTPGGGVQTIEGNPITDECLTAEEIQALTKLGREIQAEYGSPQDIEWALADGTLFLLQARPITSLFPVPEVAYEPLIVWLSFGAIQGVVGPITPLGLDVVRYLIAGAGRLFLLDLDPNRAAIFETSGERLWARMTGLLRNPLGAKLVKPIFRFIEPSIGRIVGELIQEPAVGFGQGKFRLSTLARLVYFAVPIILRFIRNVFFPTQVLARLEAKIDRRLEGISIELEGNAQNQLAAVTRMIRAEFREAFPFILPRFVSLIGPGMTALNLLTRFSGERRDLPLEVTRALPGNVTTQMDLALWETALAIRRNPASLHIFESTSTEELAQAYLAEQLPPAAQSVLAGFMGQYGMRGVGEIDFGRPRWREQPEPILQTLKSYLKIPPDEGPDAHFARGQTAAVAAVEHLVMLVGKEPFGKIKQGIVRAAARRIRLLAGSRESPKFFIIRLMGIAREALLRAGEGFVEAGKIEQPDDLVYLNLNELDELAAGKSHDWMAIISIRRADYAVEGRRKQVPRVLVSDGRAFYEGLGAETDTDEKIIGSPVSPGIVEGRVRVVLDANGAKLEPGEVLVCPGTDPAWTPLLIAASGLITEVGGLMTHGSVVAREFGIPAVVGVHQATEQLRDGQMIQLDGSTGEILVKSEASNRP